MTTETTMLDGHSRPPEVGRHSSLGPGDKLTRSRQPWGLGSAICSRTLACGRILTLLSLSDGLMRGTKAWKPTGKPTFLRIGV